MTKPRLQLVLSQPVFPVLNLSPEKETLEQTPTTPKETVLETVKNKTTQLAELMRQSAEEAVCQHEEVLRLAEAKKLASSQLQIAKEHAKQTDKKN